MLRTKWTWQHYKFAAEEVSCYRRIKVVILQLYIYISLLWHHNGRDGVSNPQPHDCLLNRLFMCRSKKTSKLRVTGLFAGNSPVFPFDDVIMSAPTAPTNARQSMTHCWLFNLLIGPRGLSKIFYTVVFKLISIVDGWLISSEITLTWMSLDFTYGKSTLVQVMAWCRSGNKPLPEPMVTQILHHHMAS